MGWLEKNKPVRDMDTILVRVPDGMKDAIHQRAKANDRSMSAEIVSILTELLEFPDEMALRTLIEQRQKLMAEERALKQQLDDLQKRLIAVNSELWARKDAAEAANAHR